MLRPVSLVDQWLQILAGLSENWADARLRLTVEGDGASRASAILGPVNPAQRNQIVRFYVARRGAGGASPARIQPLLARIDAEGIDGTLELVGSGEATEAPAVAVERATLTASWDAALAALPPDWSDLYAEVELVSSDWLERAALLMAPVNPARYGGTPGFRFRVARRFGYGASPEMTRRCLERVDNELIRGELRILRVLSETKPVHTQGPVWYVEGRSV
jgi:hypothetical protein